jgi:hypothetical protein
VDVAEDRPPLEEYLRAVGCGDYSTTPLRVAFVPKDVRRDYKLLLRLSKNRPDYGEVALAYRAADETLSVIRMSYPSPDRHEQN